jgi:hypothetical protein
VVAGGHCARVLAMTASSIKLSRILLLGAVLLTMPAYFALTQPAVADDRSVIVIHAVVLAVDPARSLVALHHEALQTGLATDRVCRLKHHRDALLLRRGTVIEATAETAHDPWVLYDVHVRARTVLPPDSSGRTI